MNQKVLYTLSLVFMISVIVMPISLANCGMQNFYMTVGCHASLSVNHCGGLNLDHLNAMRSLLVIGLSAIFYFLFAIVFRKRIYSLIAVIKNAALGKIKLLFKDFIGFGRLKPFDDLLFAYSSGLIQPKTF